MERQEGKERSHKVILVTTVLLGDVTFGVCFLED